MMVLNVLILILTIWIFIGLAINYTHGRRRR